MSMHVTDERLAVIFAEYRLWFGPPRVRFDGETVDGRRREGVFKNLPLEIRRRGIPTVDARTRGDVARLLCLASHYDRAREWIPEELTDLRDIAAYCRAQIEQVAPINARNRGRYKSRERHLVAARRDTIEHARALLIDADRHGRDIPRDALRRILKPWF